MEEEKLLDQELPPVDEPTVEFKYISDRTAFTVKNPDINKILLEISGYDLQINFNMEYIKSIEDVEATISGIGDLFRDMIMNQLLSNKQNK